MGVVKDDEGYDMHVTFMQREGKLEIKPYADTSAYLLRGKLISISLLFGVGSSPAVGRV